jgi:hypothetical protein
LAEASGRKRQVGCQVGCRFWEHTGEWAKLTKTIDPAAARTAASEEGTNEMLTAPSTTETAIVLNVNGAEHRIAVEPRVTLLDALRDRLGLTGTKKGCDHGQCGACTTDAGSIRA